MRCVLSTPSRTHCVLIHVHVWTMVVQGHERRHYTRCQTTEPLPDKLGSSPHVSVVCETGFLEEPYLLSQSEPTAHSHQGPRRKTLLSTVCRQECPFLNLSSVVVFCFQLAYYKGLPHRVLALSLNCETKGTPSSLLPLPRHLVQFPSTLPRSLGPHSLSLWDSSSILVP